MKLIGLFVFLTILYGFIKTNNSLPYKDNLMSFNYSERFINKVNNDFNKDDKKFYPVLDDSLKRLREDSIRLYKLSIDSTARLENLKHQRNDFFLTKPYTKRNHPFYLIPSQAILMRTVTIDSTGKFVTIKEKLGEYEFKNSITLPIEQYLELRKEANKRKILEDIGYTYQLKQKKDDLSDLFKDLTNIVIPLPSSDVFSIFGPNEISLSINGNVNILGAWKNEKTEGITTSLMGNEKNEPNFKQTVQINVQGMVGDKLTISADWNTERQFEFENMLKLNYKGYSDEIIQSIEAGNVSLQTTPLIGGSEALFGIKASLKFGPFSLIALASQKKSEAQELSITGGASSRTFEVRPFNYAENYYFIDKVYADTTKDYNLFYKYYGNPVPDRSGFATRFELKELEVYKSITGLRQPNEFKANAFIELKEKPSSEVNNINFYENERKRVEPINGESEIEQRFVKLMEGNDYTYNPYTGHIAFRTQLNNTDVVAVAYRIEGQTTSDVDDIYLGELEKHVVGKLDTNASRVLKLIRPKNLQPSYKKAWQLLLKNVYSLGGSRISEGGFKFEIKYEQEIGEPVDNINGKLLIQAFGLDKTDASKSGPPDGIFDWIPGRTIDPEKGDIIFPILHPFATKNIKKFFNFNDEEAVKYSYQSIYDTSKTGAQNDNIHNRYKFSGEMSASSSSTFSLNRTNVVENSVKVYLNGVQLVEGKDYVVDYMIGQVTIRKAEALVSGADLQIKFEENDMFALASKTMFGLRGVYDYNQNTSFGFSFLNLSQKTLSDKVRIGEEPISNAIMGFDFKTQFDLPFLTKAMDFLFSTSEMSSFSMQGELAYMNPDPNTKKSNIGGDNGKNIAFIDDFEGAKKLVPIPIFLGSWKDISPPYTSNQRDYMKYKARSFWFNRQNLDIRELFGDRKKVSSQNRNLTILEYVFLPNIRGAYNFFPELSEPKLNWSGMMTPLSSVANNLAEENIEYLELWINVKRADKDKKLIIDLGQISEDVIPNGILDTEDKNDNGLLDEGEDTGIDGKFDKDEVGYDPVTNPDPAGDNWKYDPAFLNDPKKLADMLLNNTEKNAAFNDNGRMPDTEDLNGNKTLDVINSYFRYEIPLDMDEARNRYIISSNNTTKWYQLRIPLKEPTKEINNPSLNVVETIRFWFEGVQDTIIMSLAEINLVGNQWQKVKNKFVTELDSVLKLATISFEENPNYEMPPGVTQEKDRTNTTEDVYKNEQSLELKITDLLDGETREIIKNIPRSLDVFNYREMKLFIHGDKNDMPGSVSYYVDPNNYATEIYFRFGLDTNNFYEYRQPVRKGWNEVRIVFDKLTSLKQGRSAEMIRTGRFEYLPELPGHRIGVKGEPSLTNIKFFIFGVVNPRDKGVLNQPVSGDIWLNELRVLDADNSKGLAYNLNTNLKMADIITLNFVYSKTDPHFRRLQERFGTRRDVQNWSVNANVDFIKMLPFYMPGSKLQLAYAHKEAFASPLYMPGTDINVDVAVEQYERNLITNGASPDSARQIAKNLKMQSQTLEVSDTYTLSGVQFKIPSNAWYINHTINNLVFNFNYNKSYSRNPTVAYGSQWNWNASMGYQVNFSNDNFFKFADIPLLGSFFQLFDDYKEAKFYFSPSNFDFIFSLDRNKNYALNRNVNNPNISRNFSSKRATGFDWIFTEGGLLNIKLKYGISYNSTYAHLLMDKNNILLEQTEKEIWNSILRGYLFGIDRDFAQDFLLSVNPRLPSFLDLNKYVSLSMNYSSKFDWQNAIEKGDLGRSARYNSKLDLSLRVELSRIGDKIFGVPNPQQNIQTQTQTPPRRGNVQTNVSKKEDDNDPVSLDEKIEEKPIEESEPFYITGLVYLKNAIQWTLFDYKQFNITYSQTNSNTFGALKSENSGLRNFWGWSQNLDNGPSRGFMLGIDNYAGPRASNANIMDLYNHNNTLSLTTSKEIWTDARFDIDWKIGWGIQKSLNITTNEDGEIESTKIQNFNGTIDRSFWFFPFIGDKIQKIKDSYQGGDKEQLAQDFVNNIEDFRIFGSFFGEFFKYVPRPNWKFTWNGLEKISFLKNHLSRLSLNHSYSSNYNESWRISPDGVNEYQTQRVSVNFSPLIGVNFTLKSFLNGLTGSFNYNLRNNYDVGFSNENLTENVSKDINFTATYTKSGFELPFFGLSLKNDITASFSFTLTNTSKTLYYLSLNDRDKEPLALDGTTRIVIEPKLKYVMSTKVSTTVFYRRTTIDPEGRSSIPKTISNEFGLEVNVQIN